jgi:putative copper export protein
MTLRLIAGLVEQTFKSLRQPVPTLKSLLRRPSGWIWLFALIAIVQAAIRLVLTPSEPDPEGGYRRVDAAFYLWLSLGIGLVLFAYGHYLRTKEIDEQDVV